MKKPPPPEAASPGRSPSTPLGRRHLRLGWLAILVFLTLGIALEALHGFKVDWYLNVANETRRLMFTLAHAHGVLLGLLHLGFAFTLRELELESARWTRTVSPFLTGATVLLPGGFFLGGVMIYDGDPGVGILLVPVGALLLLVAVGVLNMRLTKRG
ncbi:MAG: hypothetical protein ACKVXR_12195 [Planctomycetota bacterium]